MLETVSSGTTLKKGLEFAAGTAEDCKALVGKLLSPTDILGAYRTGRTAFKTGDLVLVASERDLDGIQVVPRTAYVKNLRESMGHNAPKMMRVLGIAQKSAHAVAKLPFESDAMWLVIARGQEMPVMCVLFTTPYEIESN